MSYATGTTHYNLPQTVGSDKRDWTDTNQAFSDLDTAVYGAAQGAEAATSAIQTINGEIETISGKQATDEENISTLSGKVSTLEGTTSTLGAEIIDVRQDLQDNIESRHESSATSAHAYAIGDTFYYNDILYKATAAIAIGDTIVPTVNCIGITVMSQVAAINDDLSDKGEKFRFGVDPVSGNYGYYKEEGGADTFIPFSSGGGGSLPFVKMCIVSGEGSGREILTVDSAGINVETTGNVAYDATDFTIGVTDSLSGVATVTFVSDGFYSVCASDNGSTITIYDKSQTASVTTATFGTNASNRCIIYWGTTSPIA